MEKSRYATKKKGKTEVYPFWNMKDITNMIDWFKRNEEWDGYLTFMFGILLGRRIGDTLSMKWSDLYYENGNKKRDIDTIEEQKTGKITVIPISPMVFECINFYKEKTNINPLDNLDNYIFNIPAKTEWINRRNNFIYGQNNIDKWCEYLHKDFSDKRKNDIITVFEKQKEYSTLGEYLYYVVEYMDIIKWQVDGFRRKFTKAAQECNIEYSVSCHSLRKTFGYITKISHPYDVNCMETLQDIFNHSDVQTTMHYIGLSYEKKRQYFDDMGDIVRDLEQGKTDIQINNSPIVSLKHDDIRKIIMTAIRENKQNDDMETLNICLQLVDELKIKSV